MTSGASNQKSGLGPVSLPALPFLTADTAPLQTLLCPLSGPRARPQPSWLLWLQESCRREQEQRYYCPGQR